MLDMALYAFFGGFSVFLLGFSVFMYFENRKLEDNQYTVKLLPPPAGRAEKAAVSAGAAISLTLLPDPQTEMRRQSTQLVS